MTQLPPMDLRLMRESDRSYVSNSWLRSFSAFGGEAQDYVRGARGAFGADYMPIILALIARSKVMILCLAEEPDAIIAWACWEGDVLHYLAVKTAWRRMGIARKMMADFVALPVTYTHRTRRWVPNGLLAHEAPPPLAPGATRWCPTPETWTYRRWLIWPKEKAA